MTKTAVSVLIALLAAGCLGTEPAETPAPSEEVPIELREPRLLRLFAASNATGAGTDALTEHPAGNGASGYFVNCGIVFECTWTWTWNEGTLSAPNGTTGTVHIAPGTDTGAPVDVSFSLFANGTEIASGSASEIGRIDSFLVGSLVPLAPSIAISFEASEIPDQADVMLTVNMETTQVIPSMHRRTDWDYATGVEFDSVVVHQPDGNRGPSRS